MMKDLLSRDRFDAVLFDLDGVLTMTAKIHAACWKKLFDDFLQEHARQSNEPFREFEIATDYKLYVDGKSRYDGVQSFLESRGISLPYGQLDDAPEQLTICGLANRKNIMVQQTIRTQGVEAYSGSVDLVHVLKKAGFLTAVVSASANCAEVVQSAGIAELFDIRVDGVTAREKSLAGKPAPDTFLHAARQLKVPPDRAVVVEDAVAGVQAGQAGKFGLVIGVARENNEQLLKDNGAGVVVKDLSEFVP